MMELWQACFFVLILDFTFGKDVSSNASYFIRKVDSCPDVGYFFKREPSPNLVESGPCYLCFCKDNGTAACWEREQRRCDVERYHHHRIGRQTRYRRSFSDVFFRDATRDFFGKSLPQECKPYESSFSDGCPPADWCLGCTICDCDANGKWDCHILSFCDGKENKRKVKLPKLKKNKPKKKSLDYDYPIETRSKKAPIRKTTNKTTTKPKTTKPPKKNVKKVVKAKPVNKANTRQNKARKNSTIKQKASQRFTRKPPTKAISKNHPKSNVSRVKIIKKVVATRKPINVNRNAVKGLKLNPNNSDTVKLGQKIVKQVMTRFKKILAKEIEKLNETRRTRLMEGKDCGGVKRRDKRTYNARSKIVSRKKSKYNRQGMLQENHTNARIKRETPTKGHADIISVVTLPTDVNAVIPLDNIKKENSSTTKSLSNVTSVPYPTSHQDNYFKYSIKNDSNWNFRIELAKNSTENQENDITNNLVVPVEPNNYISGIINNYYINPVDSDFNKRKFSMNYVIKNRNDERKKQVTRLLLPKPSPTASFELEKKPDKLFYGSMKQKNNLESNHDITQKHNSTTLFSIINKKPCCTEAPKITNRSDVSSLKNLLQNLFTGFNKTKIGKRKHKSNVNVLKYVRKFFHKIFSTKRTASHKVYGLGTNEDHTLQILCENIGHCKIKRNKRMFLKHKLKQLNKETTTILKSIRTVKGLLHLLELPDNGKTSNVTRNSSFHNDIQKLGVILRSYKEDEMNLSHITFNQKMQIEYIKQNTQTFLESVKKFADTLTEILVVIKPNVENKQSLKLAPKQKKYTVPLNKIKKILYQYNIMQNTFMRRMYELINGEDKKATTTEKIKIFRSGMNQNSNDKVIDKYSKDIIENLRKLKTIANVLSSKRKKRELTLKDDALEYLLTLLEVLLKQNRPLKSVPANDDDGLDVLIDAIKNAPDVKPIKETNSDYAPIVPLSRLTSKTGTSDQTSNSNSDSRRISNEENVKDFEDNGINQDQFFSEDNVLRGTITNSETQTIQTTDRDVTQKVYYRIFNQPSNNEDDFTTENSRITKKRSNDEAEKTGFDKFESYLGDPKKFEIETAYVEDDANGDFTTDNRKIINNTDTTEENIDYQTVIKNKVPRKTTAFIERSKESSSESQDLMNDKKLKLEWIEETFDRAIRMINKSLITATPRISTQLTPTTTKKSIVNISDDTKEDRTESVKRPVKKSTSRGVLYEKQMGFLNSLDYGTEKSADFEETDSKDDMKSEDVFPSYFV